MRIALLQMTSGIDPAVNAGVIAQAAAAAAAGGAAILFTPEMALLLDRDRRRAAPQIVGEADCAALAAVRAAAAAAAIWIAIGSMAVADGQQWRNRSLLIAPDGGIRARYDKMHLFDVVLASGEAWRESAAYAPGDAPVVAAGPDGLRIGLSVCYDVRFPALYQALARAEAAIIAVPAAFTVPTGAAHWHLLLRARAVETASFVIAAAQTGEHADGRTTYGHSLVIDPWGDIMIDMGDAPGLALVDIDPARRGAVLAQIPVLANARAIPEAMIS